MKIKHFRLSTEIYSQIEYGLSMDTTLSMDTSGFLFLSMKMNGIYYYSRYYYFIGYFEFYHDKLDHLLPLTTLHDNFSGETTNSVSFLCFKMNTLSGDFK